LKRQLGALFVVSVIDILGFGILIPLVPYMAHRFGAQPEAITPILGSYSLFQLLAAPLWGRLSDAYGRRAILMTSLAGACVSYAVLGFASNLGWLVVSRVLAGIMAGNIAAAFAYAADVSRPENRAAALGLVGAAIGVGFTLGPLVGGVLAGNDPMRASFGLPALVSVCLALIAILLVAVMLPESRGAAERIQHRAREREGPLKLLLQRPSLRLLAGAALLVTYAQSILESIVAIWAMNRFGFGPRAAGFLLFGVALPALLVQGGAVRVLVPRLGEARLALAGILAYAAGLIVLTQAQSVPLAVLGLVVCGTGLGAFNPSASALASKQADAHEHGAVMGTYQSSTSLARVFGPFSSGWFYQHLGSSVPFLIGACVTLPAAWLIWQARPRLAQPDPVPLPRE
jgi:DHA1 family tetracycline resistance protein-like MFS transporter